MEGNTIFINISSDYIIIDTGKNFRIDIPRNFVERYLGEELVKLYREKGFQNVIVLNGPGGFTNLRVGTLCLNILNTLLENQLNFYDISKIDLYKKAYERGILPRYGVIYIGQKRNIWLRDFERNEKIGQYSFDELKNLDEIKNIKTVFIEDIEDKEYYPEWMNVYLKYHTLFDGSCIHLIDDKTADGDCVPIDSFSWKPLKSINPNYMVEPSVTLNHSKS